MAFHKMARLMRTAVPRLTAANRLVAYCRHSGSLTVAPEQAFQAFLVKTMDEKDQLRKQMVAEANEQREQLRKQMVAEANEQRERAELRANEQRERAELRAIEERKQIVAEANEQRERAELRAIEERKQIVAEEEKKLDKLRNELTKISEALNNKASTLTFQRTSHKRYRDKVGLRILLGTQPELEYRFHLLSRDCP